MEPMHKGHLPHIPTEIMRTVVVINETGSLTKAAERMGLSQPAITAQIKRLQSLIGGEIFTRTSSGTTTTELGRLVIQQARRILDANDQLFYLGGMRAGEQPIRLGLSALFASRLLERGKAYLPSNLFIYSDHSSVLRKGLADGYIDVACFFESRQATAAADYTVVSEVDWPWRWLRAKDFVLSPGSPIPLVTFPEDDWMISTLSDQGLSYRIVFNSPDFTARMCAVRAGIGLTATPLNVMPPELMEAKEYYLPALPPGKAVLCTRPGIERKQVDDVLKQLSRFFEDECFSEAAQ
jgi:DNA-binding transcriptional LysR family regulator